MANPHLITPPSKLIQQWMEEAVNSQGYSETLTTRAAQWGADQELEACCKWAKQFNYDDYRYQDELRAARRALEALDD